MATTPRRFRDSNGNILTVSSLTPRLTGGFSNAQQKSISDELGAFVFFDKFEPYRAARVLVLRSKQVDVWPETEAFVRSISRVVNDVTRPPLVFDYTAEEVAYANQLMNMLTRYQFIEKEPDTKVIQLPAVSNSILTKVARQFSVENIIWRNMSNIFKLIYRHLADDLLLNNKDAVDTADFEKLHKFIQCGIVDHNCAHQSIEMSRRFLCLRDTLAHLHNSFPSCTVTERLFDLKSGSSIRFPSATSVTETMKVSAKWKLDYLDIASLNPLYGGFIKQESIIYYRALIRNQPLQSKHWASKKQREVKCILSHSRREETVEALEKSVYSLSKTDQVTFSSKSFRHPQAHV